jgi:hypothetical protein
VNRDRIENSELTEKALPIAIELSGRPADWDYHIAKEGFHLKEMALSEGGEAGLSAFSDWLPRASQAEFRHSPFTH